MPKMAIIMCAVAAILLARCMEAYLVSRGAAVVSRSNASPLMALKLKEVTLPLQTDPSKYESLLHEKISKAKIVRWYIARVSKGKDAVIEVIVEE